MNAVAFQTSATMMSVRASGLLTSGVCEKPSQLLTKSAPKPMPGWKRVISSIRCRV